MSDLSNIGSDNRNAWRITGPTQVAFPFAKPDNPVAQGSGALGFYLLTAVVLTSWARALLPGRWWRRLHLMAFPSFILACTHTVLAGSVASTFIASIFGLSERLSGV